MKHGPTLLDLTVDTERREPPAICIKLWVLCSLFPTQARNGGCIRIWLLCLPACIIKKASFQVDKLIHKLTGGQAY